MTWFRIVLDKEAEHFIKANNKEEALEVHLKLWESSTGRSREEVSSIEVKQLRGSTMIDTEKSKEELSLCTRYFEKPSEETLHKTTDAVEDATKQKKKKLTKEERSKAFELKRNELTHHVSTFMKKMKKMGIKVNVQARMKVSGHDYAGICMSTMMIQDALGALELAKIITTDGMRAHQAFDGMVQAMESRPDLIERFHKVMHVMNKPNENCYSVTDGGLEEPKKGGGVSG